MSVDEEKLTEFQKELYELSTKYILPNKPDSLFMVCGVLLKTCIEMYASVLSDEEIAKILRSAEQSIPMLKEKIQRAFKDLTLH